MSQEGKKHINEAIILEELFLDQLDFKISATLSLQPLPKQATETIISFSKELIGITEENLHLLRKNL